MSVDKPSLRILSQEIVYARGGKGNPVLIGFAHQCGENYIPHDYNVGYYKGTQEQKTNERRVLTRPRTVIRIGKWIRRVS